MHEETFRSLDAGATLITVNRRLSRTLALQFHAYQKERGRVVWRRPDILPLDAFLDRAWSERLWRGASASDAALLDAWQEQIVWEQAIRASPAGETLLRISETARSAAESWRLIQAYRVPVDGRFEASDDGAAFAAWSRDFQQRCNGLRWLDRARLPDFVLQRVTSNEIPKPAVLLLAGFDELTPQQSDLFAALGAVNTMDASRVTPAMARFRFDDAVQEIQAAAAWARRLLEQNPAAEIGIIVAGLTRLRRRVEHIFDQTLNPAGSLDDRERSFHLSFGPPLGDHPPVHAALLMLQFGLEGLPLPAAGLLLRSPFLDGAESEWTRRGLLDAHLRRQGVWDVSVSLLRDKSSTCPVLQRILGRFARALKALPREQRASEWSRDFSSLLQALGWPGERPLTSREHQVVEAWRDMLTDLAALDLATTPMDFQEALSRLREMAKATTFQVEDEGAPVQVMGPLEASGLRFDHLWIMGLHDEALPAPAQPNPFIPVSLQRELRLPHSSADRELEFAGELLQRLLSSAPEVVLSYPAVEGDRSLAPSPLVLGAWDPAMREPQLPRTVPVFEQFADDIAPAVVGGATQAGGARLFKDMAACPFRAFAVHRLAARPLEETTFGLSQKDRGSVVHTALQMIWGELGSHARLIELSEPEIRELIARHVASALGGLPSGIGQRLEQRRLEKLLAGWLDIEKTRDPFAVRQAEEDRLVSIGGLQVKIRADRIDELAGSRDIILDYKTGRIRFDAWDSDRPDEPQLPLYCATSDRPVAGATFAMIRTGELGFRGLTEESVSLPMQKMRVERQDAFREQVAVWRSALERLAEQYREGAAAVDPKSASTCDHCGLGALCRIGEFQDDRR